MKILPIYLIVLFAMPISLNAQFGELIDQIAKELEGSDDKDDKSKDKKDNSSSFDLGSLFGDSDIELEEAYAYNFAVEYTVETADTDGPMDMIQLYSTTENYFGMISESPENDLNIEEVIAIIDIDRNYLITINEKDEQALVLEFENVETQLENEDQKADDAFKLEKTGKTKMVAGYLCHQHLYSGTEGSGEVWVTQKIKYTDFDMFSYFKRLSQQKDVKKSSIWNSGIEGFILHIKGTDENDKPFEMLATKVDQNARYNYKMSDFKVMDMTILSGFKN